MRFTKIVVVFFQAGTKNPEDVDFKETNQDLEDNYELSFNEFKANANTLSIKLK